MSTATGWGKHESLRSFDTYLDSVSHRGERCDLDENWYLSHWILFFFFLWAPVMKPPPLQGRWGRPPSFLEMWQSKDRHSGTRPSVTRLSSQCYVPLPRESDLTDIINSQGYVCLFLSKYFVWLFITTKQVASEIFWQSQALFSFILRGCWVVGLDLKPICIISFPKWWCVKLGGKL